jgi:hypothetical protein
MISLHIAIPVLFINFAIIDLLQMNMKVIGLCNRSQSKCGRCVHFLGVVTP